jgi:hypothetical protein
VAHVAASYGPPRRAATENKQLQQLADATAAIGADCCGGSKAQFLAPLVERLVATCALSIRENGPDVAGIEEWCGPLEAPRGIPKRYSIPDKDYVIHCFQHEPFGLAPASELRVLSAML